MPYALIIYRAPHYEASGEKGGLMLDKMDRSFLQFAITLYIPGFFIKLGFSIVSPILPIYAESFGIPYALVGMVTTANALGRLLSDIPLGTLSDRLGRRPLAIIGPLLVTCSAILCGLAQGFYELLLYRFITGIGMATWMVARQAMIADSVNPSIRGRVMSTFQGVNMIGSAAGPAVGGIIAELWGYRTPFFFYGASTFVSLVVSLLLVKESADPKRPENRSTLMTDMHALLGFLTFSIVMAAFTNFVNHIRFAARGTIIPLFGENVLHLTAGEIGLVLSASTITNILMVVRGQLNQHRPISAPTITNILMVVPGGYIVDKYGRKFALVPSFIFTGIVFVLFSTCTDFSSALLVSAILGVASGLGGGATMALAADLAPEGLRGQFMGFWQTVGDVGSAIGPVALGFVADLYGLVSPFYVTCAIMLIVAATTQLFVKETLKKEKSGS